jgi:hypothetical protein
MIAFEVHWLKEETSLQRVLQRTSVKVWLLRRFYDALGALSIVFSAFIAGFTKGAR